MGNFQDKVLEEGAEGDEEVFIQNGPKETAQFLVNSLVEASRRIDINTDENSNNLTRFQSLWIVEHLLKYGFPFTFRHDALQEASIFRLPLEFSKRKQAKRDLTLLAMAIFSASDELKEFWESYNEYNEESILRWYFKKGNIYKVLNYSLQTSLTCSIQYCRLVLKDLSRAITSKYLSSANPPHNRLAYSEVYVTPEKWDLLKSYIGSEIKVDRFFSATKIKQKPENSSRENHSKKVSVTIVMMNPPSRIQKEEIQGFVELENGNDILFNLDSKFTILDANDHHLLLLYGKYEILKYLQQAQPNIAVKRTNIYQKKCSQCQTLFEELQRKFLFVDLIDQASFVCSDCLLIPQQRTPLFLISPHIEQNMTPDGSEDPALNLPGLIINYPDDIMIPFYRYKCADCEQINLNGCFKCVTCCSPRKEWCVSADCQLEMAECLDKGHNIVFERSPFTYWPRKPPTVQNNSAIAEDETLETAQYFNERFHYEEVLEYYTLKDVILIANSYCKLGCQYFEKEDYHKAKEFHLKAFKIREELYRGKKHPHLAISYNNLGKSCFMLGEIDEAFTYHTKAFKIRESAFGQEHFATADSLNNLGMIYLKWLDYSQASDKVSQALDIRRRRYNYNHERNAIYNNNLAIIYSAWGAGHENEAETHYLRAQEIWRSLGKANSFPMGKSFLGLGLIYKNKKDYGTASDFIFKALEILKNYQLPSCELKIAEGLSSLGDLNKSQNRFTEAIREYQEALGYFERSQGDNNTAIGMAYKNLGEISLKLERYDEAKDYYLLAKEWYEKNNSSNSGLIASRFDELGFVFKRLGNYEDAKQMFKIAIEIKEKHFGENNLLTKQSKNNLQDLLSQLSS